MHAARLRSIAPRSRGWLYTGGEDVVVDQVLEGRARELIEARTDAFPQWAWSDPRSVFFLDFWRKAIPGLGVLLLWRPCDEVVRALGSAGDPGMRAGVVRAVRAWRSYNERALAYKDDHPRESMLLELSALTADDRRALERIGSRLGFELEAAPLELTARPEPARGPHVGYVRRALYHHYGVAALEAAMQQASDAI
jgi:hypothetical protein